VSLVALLVAVGLVVWLAAGALPDGSDDGGGRRTTPAPPPSSAATAVAVEVAPAAGLADGDPVRVVATGLPAGAAIEVATCTAGATASTLGDACSAAVTAGRADASGRAELEHRVARVVGGGSVPIDCASRAGTCVVLVRSAAGPTATGSAPIAFRSDLPPPEITLPGG
jgi:hypothetical protein